MRDLRDVMSILKGCAAKYLHVSTLQILILSGSVNACSVIQWLLLVLLQSLIFCKKEKDLRLQMQAQ